MPPLVVIYATWARVKRASMFGAMSLETRGSDPPRSIAVFRALYLGDMLCAVPAVRSLRKAYPEARITLIGLPWAETFVDRFAAYFDDFLSFPGYPGLQAAMVDEGATKQFFESAIGREFDLAVQMHGSGSVSNAVISQLGARRVLGYYPEGGPYPEIGHFLTYPSHGSEVERNLRLVGSLGIPAEDGSLDFPVLAADRSDLCQALGDVGVELGDYVCVHPGAKLPSRRWPAERFGAIADHLAARGLQVVLTGSAEEHALASDVASSMRRAAINLAGHTSLGAMGALLTGARLLVSNDTGASHIAAAVRTPSVIVANGSDVERWAPADAALHSVLSHNVDCRPCSYEVCPIGHPCALGVSVDAVIAAVDGLLSTTRLTRA